MSVKAVRVKDIMGVMEEIAPKKLAEEKKEANKKDEAYMYYI